MFLLGFAASGALQGQSPVIGSAQPSICGAIPNLTHTGIATPLDDLDRMLALGAEAGESRMVRRHSEARWAAACQADSAPTSAVESTPRWEATLLPARVDLQYRTGYPDDRNNGPVWAGRGLSTILEVGGQLSVAIVPSLTVSAAFVPAVTYQGNAEFDFPERVRPGLSPYIYPHYSPHIDLPHRHGPESFSTVEWGQSYIRADAYGLTAGFSTENLWWGPASRYPILMSNTAAGPPHFFLGTSGPVDIWVGLLDAELIWSRTLESDYFDQVPENDQHMMGGLALAFSPRPLPGLWLGLARIYHSPDDRWSELNELLATTGLRPTTGAGNEMVSIFGRWVFPAAEAEVYAEWAREDRSWDFPELLQEPDHSQAYTIGFQKLTPLLDRFGIRVQGELAALQDLVELRTGSRPVPMYYIHDKVTQGHTHRGQLLGTGIGPGADAQFIAVDLVADRGLAGIFAERVRRATFATRAISLRRQAPYEHDAEITGGIRSTFLIGNLSISSKVAYSYRYNRDFGDDDTNWSLGIEGVWLPGTDFRFP